VTELFKDALGNHYPEFLKKPGATGYIWDCLAAGYLIDPSFVTKSEKLFLDVDATFSEHYGAVRSLDRQLAPGNVRIGFGKVQGLGDAAVLQDQRCLDQPTDPRGREYFWNSSVFSLGNTEDDTDVAALRDKYVCITPLQFDLTHHDMTQRWRGKPWELK